MYRDILEDSWVVQEERREGKRDGLRQALLAVVQARFPEIIDLMKKQIDGAENPESLQDLLVKISLAENVEDATMALFALDKTNSETDTGHDVPAVSG
ncbi:MAG TPA: hypothetical protein VNW73_12450 [Ktedonobacteraceae bacterium]|nr:hypothetical protein [Ktedonobacteraceae bacterium]